MTTGMGPRDGWRRRLIMAGLVVVGTISVQRSTEADDVPPAADEARRAVAAIAPDLPGEVVAAMQGGSYDDAIRALDALIAADKTTATDRSFARLVRGTAARLAGRPDDARATWQAALDAEPRGVWGNKLRGELAALELATGHPDRAEALARAEAETLLAPDRKDRLAGVYREFARRLLDPPSPNIPANPRAAYVLLAQARDLARGAPLRAEILVAMGQAGQAALLEPAATPTKGQAAPKQQGGLSPNAIRDYTAYLREYPEGADRDRVRFHLGEVQLTLRDAVAARGTWTDLARDLGRGPVVERDRDRQALRGRALAGIARTYGMPTPPDNRNLDLGVAALRAFLAATPADPGAPAAAFQIGEAYLHRGQGDPAIAAFAAFLKGDGFRVETDEARRTRDELAGRATFLIARATLGQGKFPAAIAAFEAYLARFPAGPDSADARRAILDAHLLAADDAFGREAYAEARAGWLEFAEANPLDSRVPEALFHVGRTRQAEHKWDEAIAAWDALAVRFPATIEAAQGRFQAASLVEVEQGDPAAAIERFRKLEAVPALAEQARQRIAVMEVRALTVVTPRTFRSGEVAHLKVSTRNLERLTFSAYKLNPEAYFRKKRTLGGVAGLDIGLVAPDAEWTVAVPNYARYRPLEADFDLKVAIPGVYVVKVTDDKALQAAALVIGSDLEAIVKASADQVLIFAQDMKTGQGRGGAKVIVADDAAVVFEGTTGADGVVQGSWQPSRPPASPAEANEPPTPDLEANPPPVPQGDRSPFNITPPPPNLPNMAFPSVAPQAPPPPRPAASLRYLVVDGLDAAGSGLDVSGEVAHGLAARAYIDTDRPAYRPGQEIQIRGVVREVRDGQYANPAGQVYKLEVADSQRRTLLTQDAKLSAFGTFRASVQLAEGAPVGSYQIKVRRPGGSEFAGGFEVQSYQLARIGLEFDLPRTVFYRGETVRGTLRARYGYYAPATARPIAVRLPDGRTVRGQTDARGEFAIEFATDEFAEDRALALRADLTADAVAARATVRVAVLGFGIALSTPRTVYLDGETFNLAATTLDALGQPTGQDLRVALIRPVRQGNAVVEREVGAQTFRTDPTTGKGQVPLKFAETTNAEVILRVAGTDRFGHPIVADHRVTISGRGDADRLRVLADRTDFKVGEAAAVRLVNRGKSGTALVAWEADRIVRYRLFDLKEGENRLDWEVEGPEFPNVSLTASRMDDRRFDQARVDLKVERDLRITLAPKLSSVAPGAEVEVEITAVDQLGRPAQAELALALVDQALLRQFGDRLPPIGPFFYDQTRLGSFATAATNTFADHPVTEPIPDAILDEDNRRVAFARDEVSREQVGKQLAQGGRDKEEAPLIAMSAAPAESFQRRALGAATGRYMNDDVQYFASDLMGNDQTGGTPFPNRSFADIPNVLDDDDSKAKVSFRLLDAPMEETDKAMAGMSYTARSVNGINVPQPRREVVETAYWNPAVVTGPDGKAVVKFAAPAALSEYRLLARGITGADTLAGQASTTIAVRKAFYVKLRASARLTEGDSPRFLARVHHVGLAAGTVVPVKLASYAGDQDRVDPKTVTIAGDGVDEVLFDPITIPDAESIRLTVSARAGDQADEVVAEVPILPWGVQVTATASGTADTDARAVVDLGPGRWSDVGMQIQLAPSLDRLVLELALATPPAFCRHVIPVATTADRAADLLAAAAGLKYLGEVRAASPADFARLRDRARGLAAELVAGQAADGGWPWAASRAGGTPHPSDRLAASVAAWALQSAREVGIEVDPGVLDRAGNYLTVEFGRTAADPTARAAVLHALATLGRANFEAANALNRSRANLPDAALAHLALAFGRLDRAGLAGEVLDALAARARTEPAGPGEKPRTYWDGPAGDPRHRGRAEATALASLAFAQIRPTAPEFTSGVAWLLAHREWSGWAPHRAGGPAVAAIAASRGKAGAADDRYRLVIAVNDVEVARLDVVGVTEARTIAVPRRILKVGGPNTLRFAIEGRGTFGYAATMTGFARDFAPMQLPAGKPITVQARDYLPAPLELDGKALPTGFDSVVNPTRFVNKATEVTRGGRIGVAIDFEQSANPGATGLDRGGLIIEESLPAGGTLVDGSIESSASSVAIGDGTLSFAFAPGDGTPRIRYEVAGALPGTYRALPTLIRAADDGAVVHLGPVGNLRVLAPGDQPADGYRPTPDELLARGRGLAAAGRLAEASIPLEALLGGYTPHDEVARDAARILLSADIRTFDARKVVRDFEILKEKGPDVVIPFDEVLVVGRAYREIGEFERAFLVFRALAEASYLEDGQVGEALRRDGRTLEAIAYLLDLWRESPGSAAIEADHLALGQILADTAERAGADPPLRTELARANLGRPELLLQAIRLVRATLVLNPKTPLADEASLALLGNELGLEDFEAVTRLAPRYAALYPKSPFLDSFQYADALGRFQLGQYDRAIEVAERIARATYPNPEGVPQPSPNKWQALYILGQIHDARRQPAQAVEFYRQVADRFVDAADAVLALDRRALKLPEVTIVRPPTAPPIGAAVALDPPPAPASGGVVLAYRNVGEVDVKVYPVDLMRLYLARRNLDAIAGVDLAGITPLHEATIKLGDPMTYADATRTLDLPLTREGAYLVMVRGGDLYASGIVLVTPLKLEVTEEADAGRVRVVVRDAATDAFVAKVQVKVIGAQNASFTDGRTDRRGVVIADGIIGPVTAVARNGAGQYAFYRGTEAVGRVPMAPKIARPQAAEPNAPAGAKSLPGQRPESLEGNLRSLNAQNQSRGIDRFRQRLNEKPSGVRAQEAK